MSWREPGEVAGCGFEIVELIHEKDLDCSSGTVEPVGIDAVEATAPVTALVDNARIEQDSKVLRHCWPTHRHCLGQF